MPVYQDSIRKSWYFTTYYKDWTGEKKRKLKRGFQTKKEAQKAEIHFLECHQSDCALSFDAFLEQYLNGLTYRVKPQTLSLKRRIFEKQILPYFKNKKLSEITSLDILNWQKHLLTQRTKNKKPFSGSYLRAIEAQLSAAFRYGCLYYGLSQNPCAKVPSLGTTASPPRPIWTLEEFRLFSDHVFEADYHLAFSLLFWCGLRKGELLALTYEDFNDKDSSLSVVKTYQIQNGVSSVSSAKTPKSNRTVTIPAFLYQEFLRYRDKANPPALSCRVFPFSQTALNKKLSKIAERCSLPSIRVHDLRHSHVSMLLEMEMPLLEISERIGHEKPQTTLNIYAHLYPDKQKKLAEKLDDLEKENLSPASCKASKNTVS